MLTAATTDPCTKQTWYAKATQDPNKTSQRALSCLETLTHELQGLRWSWPPDEVLSTTSLPTLRFDGDLAHVEDSLSTYIQRHVFHVQGVEGQQNQAEILFIPSRLRGAPHGEDAPPDDADDLLTDELLTDDWGLSDDSGDESSSAAPEHRIPLQPLRPPPASSPTTQGDQLTSHCTGLTAADLEGMFSARGEQ